MQGSPDWELLHIWSSIQIIKRSLLTIKEVHMACVRIKYVTHLEWFMACRVKNLMHQRGRMAHQREKEVFFHKTACL